MGCAAAHGQRRITRSRGRTGHLVALLAEADADGQLRVPRAQAIGLVHALTTDATWSALVDDNRLEPDAAIAVTRHTLETAVRSPPAG